MNQEKPMVNVLFHGGYTLVIAGPDGREQTFYRNTNRTMYLEVRQLRLSDNRHPMGGVAGPLDLGDVTAGSPTQAALSVRGRASLGGGSVSVMGDAGNTAHILDIDFTAVDENIYKRQQQDASRRGMKEPYVHVTLGFAHQRQSAAGSADWFVVCELAPDALRAISGALSSGRLHAMTVGLALPEVYSDDWTHPPAQTSWFLQPNDRSTKTDRPQRTYGHVTCLSFELAASGRHRPLEEPDELKDFEVTEAGPLAK